MLTSRYQATNGADPFVGIAGSRFATRAADEQLEVLADSRAYVQIPDRGLGLGRGRGDRPRPGTRPGSRFATRRRRDLTGQAGATIVAGARCRAGTSTSPSRSSTVASTALPPRLSDRIYSTCGGACSASSRSSTTPSSPRRPAEVSSWWCARNRSIRRTQTWRRAASGVRVRQRPTRPADP